jgi:hypothetical protein
VGLLIRVVWLERGIRVGCADKVGCKLDALVLETRATTGLAVVGKMMDNMSDSKYAIMDRKSTAITKASNCVFSLFLTLSSRRVLPAPAPSHWYYITKRGRAPTSLSFLR